MSIYKKMLVLCSIALLAACSEEAVEEVAEEQGLSVSAQTYTDSLFAVMNADRTNYTALIIDRLGPAGAGAITPNEYWEDHENGSPLPAQMFRFGAEGVAEVTDVFSYSLQSSWCINKQNCPSTPMEIEGLKYVEENVGENFYGEEELGGVTYFTAVYPDVAVTAGCVACHNGHIDSPRDDFVLGEVMGGVVIRVPFDNL